MWMLNVFSSKLDRTLNEAGTIVLTLDLYFVKKLSEWDKMELVFEITHSMHWVTSLLFLVFVDRGDAVDLISPAKEMDT